MTTAWSVQCFQSGTVVVVQGYDVPHYYIFGKSDHARYTAATELAAWLTDGPKPAWTSSLVRISPTKVAGPDHLEIIAVGPMKLPPNDNGRLAWRQVDEDEPARIALIDRLFT